VYVWLKITALILRCPQGVSGLCEWAFTGQLKFDKNVCPCDTKQQNNRWKILVIGPVPHDNVTKTWPDMRFIHLNHRYCCASAVRKDYYIFLDAVSGQLSDNKQQIDDNWLTKHFFPSQMFQLSCNQSMNQHMKRFANPLSTFVFTAIWKCDACGLLLKLGVHFFA
jgi:hypothetical protein